MDEQVALRRCPHLESYYKKTDKWYMGAREYETNFSGISLKEKKSNASRYI